MNHIDEQVQDIWLGFSRIQQEKGKRKEIAIKRLRGENVSVWEAFKMYLDPAVAFHVDKKILEKQLPEELATNIMDDFDTLCAYCAGHLLTTDEEIANVQWSLNGIKIKDYREYAIEFLCRKIPLGVTAKTVNRIVGHESIPELRIMEALPYEGHQEELAGKHFHITQRLGGVRCIAKVDSDKIALRTEHGKPIEGLTYVEETLARIREYIGKPFVMDGELLSTYDGIIPCKERLKRTIKILDRPGAKGGITFYVADVLDFDAFQGRCCETPYYKRRQKLETYCNYVACPFDPASVLVQASALWYHGKDMEQIDNFLDAERYLNHAGIVIYLADEPYQFGPTSAALYLDVG